MDGWDLGTQWETARMRKGALMAYDSCLGRGVDFAILWLKARVFGTQRNA